MTTTKNFAPFTVQVDFLWDEILKAGIQFSSPKKWNLNQANFVYREYKIFFTVISPELCFFNDKSFFFSNEAQTMYVKELAIDGEDPYYPAIFFSLRHGTLDLNFTRFVKTETEDDDWGLPLTGILDYYGNPFDWDDKYIKELNSRFVENGWSKTISRNIYNQEEVEFNHKFFRITCRKI